jgi:Family of unknown function (DUF5825)
MSVQAVDITRLSRQVPPTSNPAPPVERARDPLVVCEVGTWPPQLASQELIAIEARRGLRRVQIKGYVDLAAFGLAAQALRVIRDLTSCRIHVEWCLMPDGGALTPLHGLQPPYAIEGKHARDLHEWKDRFRFGLLYWRAGPGFVIIRDAREAAINHFTLDEPEYIDAVRRGHAGEGLAEADPAALTALAEEGLVLFLKEQPVFLPYRMKHWPIPFNSV